MEAPSTSLAKSGVALPTPEEGTALRQLFERQSRTSPRPIAKLDVRGDGLVLSWDHADQVVAAALWANALGTSDLGFAATALRQVVQSCGAQAPTADELNGMLAYMCGLAPADPTEALLVTQMVVVHNATMAAARRLATAASHLQQESASTALNKLARTFAAQLEALKRYRHKGEQTITVQHVTVNEGGQAIVGTVRPEPGPGKKEQPIA